MTLYLICSYEFQYYVSKTHDTFFIFICFFLYLAEPTLARSTKYPVIGEPPSCAGAFHDKAHVALVTSVTSSAEGAPGGAVIKMRERVLSVKKR